MKVETGSYRLSRQVPLSFDAAVARVRDTLKEQGFGVLTEIDLQRTLKDKIGVDIPRQVILGACNPQFAWRALQADADVSLLLPCNVVVRETSGGSEVAAVDPRAMLGVAEAEGMRSLAEEVRERLSVALSVV